MSKFIVTLCSLALTFAGTFGANQLSLKNNDDVISNSDKTAIVKSVEATDEQCDQKAGIDAKATEDNTADTTAKAETAAPAEAKKAVLGAQTTEADTAVKVVNKATNSQNCNTKNNTTTNQNCNAVNTTTTGQNCNVVNSATTNQNCNAVNNATTNQNCNAVNNATTNKNCNAANNDTTNQNCNTKNGKVVVYSNVNLSDCKNAQEIVNKLQQNGFDNINMNNIQDISSLKDILANLNESGNLETKAPEAAPTKAPEATPTKAPEATPTPSAAPTNNNTGISSYAAQVLQLINQERAKEGLSALTTNSTLQAAADKRAQEIVQSFSHTRPDGSSFSTVLKEYGITYRAAGENIAYGQKTPQEVVTAWMNSSGHRANIMNANYGKVGIGVYQKNGVIYWSQEFTN